MTEAKRIDGTEYEYGSIGLRVRPDAHIPTGPDDVRVIVSDTPMTPETMRLVDDIRWRCMGCGHARREHLDGPCFAFVVDTLEFSEYCKCEAFLVRSTRTRWLTFYNANGNVVKAPAVRTHQLTLLFGMGKEWYFAAMRLPDDTTEVTS